MFYSAALIRSHQLQQLHLPSSPSSPPQLFLLLLLVLYLLPCAPTSPPHPSTSSTLTNPTLPPYPPLNSSSLKISSLFFFTSPCCFPPSLPPCVHPTPPSSLWSYFTSSSLFFSITSFLPVLPIHLLLPLPFKLFLLPPSSSALGLLHYLRQSFSQFFSLRSTSSSSPSPTPLPVYIGVCSGAAPRLSLLDMICLFDSLWCQTDNKTTTMKKK